MHPPGPPSDDQLRARIADALGVARRRWTQLLARVPDAELQRQHSPLMSPLSWDIAHVAGYEEQWILRGLAGDAPMDRARDDLYDAFKQPRALRPALPLLSPAQARAWGEDVRARALAILAGERFAPDDPLRAGGFVWGMVAQHEQQHVETMLATLSLMAEPGYRPVLPPRPPVAPVVTEGEVLVPAGGFTMGTSGDPWAYDNERPAHVVVLPAFGIDVAPVSNAAYVSFVADGGYRDPRWWSADGWRWREAEDARAPLHWSADGAGGWRLRRFGWALPLPLGEPVEHVSFFEAEAYARWAGKRLPSEAEWEKAAAWAPDGASRRYPWGDDEPDERRANLARDGGGSFGPALLGAYPTGRSAAGCLHMLGDVWEWTSSDFLPYPGFRAFPYPEYSQVFFGPSYKVLRGGSWATHPTAVRNTFRNWDLPVRRQIFCGFRCARDA